MDTDSLGGQELENETNSFGHCIIVSTLLKCMMKFDWQWEVTNKYIYNVSILCYKTADEFSLRGPYVGILGYLLGRFSSSRW